MVAMKSEDQSDENAPISVDSGVLGPASGDDLSWAVVNMHAGARITLNRSLIDAYQAASSPHSVRALKSELEAC